MSLIISLISGAVGGNIAGALMKDYSLGMSPDMVKKFQPIVLDYAGKYGGSAAKSALASVF